MSPFCSCSRGACQDMRMLVELMVAAMTLRGDPVGTAGMKDTRINMECWHSWSHVLADSGLSLASSLFWVADWHKDFSLAHHHQEF